MNIILIGMPGVGKTTTGKRIARKLDFQFIDIDTFIEKEYKTTINSIFEKLGESAFRKLEHKNLKHIINIDNHVISTGGGLPCFNNNIDILLENGIVIYLKMSPKMIRDRLVNSRKKRPMTIDKSPEEILNYVEKTLSGREKYYQKANFIVDAGNVNLISFIEKYVMNKSDTSLNDKI